MLSQSSHFGHLRRIAGLRPGRPSRTGSLQQRGYKGANRPRFIAEVNGQSRLVEPSSENPNDVVPLDELVAVGEQGDEHHIRLFPGMRPDDLRTRIQKTGLTRIQKWYLRSGAEDDVWEKYVALVKDVLSPSHTEELPPTEAGKQCVRVRSEFQFTSDYYRAIAKIAFHYYLVHNERGFRGDEPYFRDIRRFIKDGKGCRDEFFRSSGAEFATRFGRTASGGVVVPGQWCHLLAVSEANNLIVVFVQLFLGPENIPEPVYVTLAEIDSPIVLPNGTWGHVYQMDPTCNGKYAGHVLSPTIGQVL
jgi:hypothetical protein